MYMNAYCCKYVCTFKPEMLFTAKGMPQSIIRIHSVLVIIILLTLIYSFVWFIGYMFICKLIQSLQTPREEREPGTVKCLT